MSRNKTTGFEKAGIKNKVHMPGSKHDDGCNEQDGLTHVSDSKRLFLLEPLLIQKYRLFLNPDVPYTLLCIFNVLAV